LTLRVFPAYNSALAMPKAFVSYLLALCYLSVSLSAFNVHFHDHSDRLQHSCPACAWHSESVSDEPAGPIVAAVPVVLVATVSESQLQIFASIPRTFSDRGPPFLS
jgi:hypothetical protein